MRLMLPRGKRGARSHRARRQQIPALPVRACDPALQTRALGRYGRRMAVPTSPAHCKNQMKGRKVAPHSAGHTARAWKEHCLLLPLRALAAPFTPSKTEGTSATRGPQDSNQTSVLPPPLNESLLLVRTDWIPWPGEEKTPWARGGESGGRETLGAGPLAPETALGPGRRPWLTPAPRGRWTLHAHAADTATRPSREGRGSGEPTRARPSAARACGRWGGGGGRAWRGLRERHSDFSLSQLLRLGLVLWPPCPAHTPAYLRG